MLEVLREEGDSRRESSLVHAPQRRQPCFITGNARGYLFPSYVLIYSHMDVLSSGIVPPKLSGLGSLDIVNDADDAM